MHTGPLRVVLSRPAIGQRLLGIACGCLGLTSGCLPDLDPPPDDGVGVAIYDPDTSTIPFPNDLATDILTGRVLLDADDATDATKQFFNVINLLDGFFPNSQVFTTVSERLDPDTVNSNNVIVVDLTDETAPLPKLTIDLDDTGTKIRITPNPQWTRDHRYGIALRGGRDGLRTEDDDVIIGDELMVFLKARDPLVDNKGRARLSPLESIERSMLIQMESARALNAQLLDRLEAAQVVRRDDVAQAWTFKTHSRPSIVFDPQTAPVSSLPFSRIPFPNDFVRDQSTGLVALPELPVDVPEVLRPLLEVARLNSLDGFSTTAAITIPIDAPLKAASLTPGNVLLINTDDLKPVPIAVSQRDGNLVLQPLVPLEPGAIHFVGISDVVTDDSGSSAAPFPMTVLLRSEFPLADGEGNSLVDGLADADAAQLEVARRQFKLPIEVLRLNRLTREHIVGMFGFKTQRTTTRLQEIRKELRDAIQRDATFDDVTVTFESFASALAAGRIPGSQSSTNIAFVATGTFRTLNYIDPATGSFDEAPEMGVLRFVATFPATVAAPRIVLLQHDFGGWRHDLFPLADQLAGTGVATLRIDAPNHGDRSLCRVSTDCAGAGTCDLSTGRCSTDFVRDADGKPLASGRGFTFGRGRMSTKELFNSRDLMRQAAVDLFQATNVARATGPESLAAAASGTGFNGARASVQFVGNGLGGMLGTVFTAVEADVRRAVLSAAASSLVDLFFTSTALGPELQADLALVGIAQATPELEQFRTIARWILDPAEPANYARFSVAQPLDDFAIEDAEGDPVQMSRRELLVLKAGNDNVVPGSLTDELAKVLAPNPNITEGLLFKAYAGACHDFLTQACTGGAQARQDVLDFLAGAAVAGVEVR